MLWLGLGIFVIVSVVLGLALCRSATRADEGLQLAVSEGTKASSVSTASPAARHIADAEKADTLRVL